MTDEENAVQFSIDTGYMPITNTALNNETIQNLHKEKVQYSTAAKQLEHASQRPGVVGYVEATEKLMNEMRKALMDLNVDVEETVEKATSIMQQVVDKNNK